MAEQVIAQRPITLTVNAIVNGAFFSAGAPLPFKDENELPETLRPFVASEAAPPPEPVQRDIYDLPLSIRRQVRGLERTAAEKAWAEQQASEPLREDVAAALEAEHDTAIGLAKAKAQYNQDVVDAAYEAAQPAPPRQLYVKRGGAMGQVERCRLKPGELIFAR